MALNKPYDNYMNNAVMSSNPGQLTLMLYSGAVKFIKQSVHAMDNKSISEAHHYLTKAQNIITHLRETLNMDYELSHDLDRIYEFINLQLVQANLKKDKSILEEVLPLVEDLRDTWSQVLKQNNR